MTNYIMGKEDKEFNKRLKELQGKIQAMTGKKPPSLLDLTSMIIRTAEFDALEKRILEMNLNKKFEARGDIKLKWS